MLKSLEQAMSGTPEQTYLAERLQSAKWLGWEMQAPATPPRKPADTERAGSILGDPAVPAKPA